MVMIVVRGYPDFGERHVTTDGAHKTRFVSSLQLGDSLDLSNQISYQ